MKGAVKLKREGRLGSKPAGPSILRFACEATMEQGISKQAGEVPAVGRDRKLLDAWGRSQPSSVACLCVCVCVGRA